MVDAFIELNEKRCLPNALMRMESQEGNCPSFDIDYRLKEWIFIRIARRSLSGRERYHLLPQKSRSKKCTFLPVRRTIRQSVPLRGHNNCSVVASCQN
jgi:hypothetical protein